jgi:hypothetical protein
VKSNEVVLLGWNRSFCHFRIIHVNPAPASKPSLLGYYAHCSFTPISTIVCFVIAGEIYWFEKRKK